MTLKNFSRRNFLKATSIAGGVAMFAPGLLSSTALASTGEAIISASHWGVFFATAKDGKITGYTPWDKDPMPNNMLDGLVDSVDSTARIKFPMVRKSVLEGGIGSKPELRGADEMVRVSWKEALELTAQGLKDIREKHGPEGIFGGSYGWKSTGKLHNARTVLSRFLNMTGGYVNHIGDYSTGASQVIMPHVVGRLEVYEQQTAWPVVVDNTETLVFWGADPVKTNRIGWIIPDHGYMPGIEAYKATGKKVIVIDPVQNETAKYMDAEWIPIRPHTDVALMLGVAHVIYEKGLHDEAFLSDYTTGFDKFLPYLTGESDGVAKNAAWAAEICDVPVKQIEKLAELFTSSRTMLASGWSIQRQHHGEQSHWMLVTLASMIGQIGLPGGGFGLSYHYSSGGSPSAGSPIISGISDGGKEVEGAAWLSDSGVAAIPLARIVDMLEKPGEKYDFNGKSYTYPDVHAIVWAGGNPFSHHQDRNRMVKAWRSKPQLVVVADYQWTATARFADIVLPATSTLERNDIEQYGDYAIAGIIAQKKVVEPMYEAKNDYDIFAELSDLFGVKDKFTEGKEEMDWIKEFYDAAREKSMGTDKELPAFEDFWKTGYVHYEPTEEGKSYVRYGEFREDPLFNALGTPSGLIEIYSSTIEKMNYDDCPAHPTWMEPIERLGMKDAKFDFHVCTGHPRMRLHSQLCGTKLREEYAVADREPVWINTKDAKKLGIKNGDVCRIFNDRGQILAGAVVTDEIRESVIWVAEGGWYDPAKPTEDGTVCAYGDVNVLTPDLGTSKLAQGNCGSTCIANIEKFEGELPEVKVFTALA